MTIYDRLKKAFRTGTGVRLSALDVRRLVINDVAIRDAVYADFDEYVRDLHNPASVPENNEPDSE